MPTPPHNSGHDVIFSGRPALPSEGSAIIRQERDGQQSFVNSDALPSDMSADDRLGLETAGVVFGEPVDGDPIFTYVTLPEGWRKVGTDHDMWSDLVDNKGRKRAGIFYKAAFYDRSARLNVERRFSVSEDYDAQDGTVAYRVIDFGEIVFKSDPVAYMGVKYGRRYERAKKKAFKACESWLKDNGFKDWKNPGKYWD